MIAVLVITDGRRDCIVETIRSASTMLYGPISLRLIYDDSGDPEHRVWLCRAFIRLGYSIMWHDEGRQGFGGAIRAAWSRLRTFPGWEFLFHLEDDFTFNRAVPLGSMAETLRAHPHLAQLALRRQPWNDDERAAGGIVEQNPDDFVEHCGGYGTWLEHRRFFTTNPSLYPRSILAHDWPEGPNSEGRFSLQLAEDPDLQFGYWGARSSGEAVHHIGRERVGTGY